MSQKGFTLVEALIAGSVALVGCLAIANLLLFSGKVNLSITQTNDFQSLRSLLTMALANPATCPQLIQTGSSGALVEPPASLSVASPAIPTTGLPVGRIASGTTILADTAAGANPSFATLSMTLMPLITGNPDPAVTVPYVMNLHLSATKPSPPGSVAAVGGSALSADIPIQVTIVAPASGSPTIAACYTQNSSVAPPVRIINGLICQGSTMYSALGNGGANWMLYYATLADCQAAAAAANNYFVCDPNGDMYAVTTNNKYLHYPTFADCLAALQTATSRTSYMCDVRSTSTGDMYTAYSSGWRVNFGSTAACLTALGTAY